MKLTTRKQATKVSSHQELRSIASRVLLASDVDGILPTPIEPIADFAELKPELDLEAVTENAGLAAYLAKIGDSAKALLLRGLDKVVGAVDRRQRVYYVDPSINTIPRKKRVAFHEISHQLIPWQRDIAYFDDNSTLSPWVRRRFEAEANSLAVDLMFQGSRFAEEAKEYESSIWSMKYLADRYGSSFHATARRYVEESRRACLLVMFHGETRELRSGYWYHVVSGSFERKYGGVDLFAEKPLRRFLEDALHLHEHGDLEDEITVRIDGKGNVDFGVRRSTARTTSTCCSVSRDDEL